MTYQEFKESIEHGEEPVGLSPYLNSLWHDASGHWEKAHEMVQDLGDSGAAWIHGYLHRKEGDRGNASYWYHRAGKSFPTESLDEELDLLIRHFIEHR